MENNIILSISLALLAMFIHSEYLMGTSMLSRPIVSGALTGLIMGDPVQGIILGANFELAFIGAFAIGAVIPPDMISGTILGIAFAIVSGNGNNPAVALSLALPIASLVVILKNIFFVTVMPYFIHKADKYAENLDYKGINRMQILGGLFTTNILIGLVVGFSFYLGASSIKNLLDMIPQYIIQGLAIATGLLPAYGLAILLRLTLNKKNFIFLVFGFALSVYMKIPVTGVAIFSIILAIIMSGFVSIPSYVNNSDKNLEVENEEF